MKLDRTDKALIAIVIVSLATLLFIGFYIESEKRSMYKKCLDDGKKDYECFGLILGGRILK